MYDEKLIEKIVAEVINSSVSTNSEAKAETINSDDKEIKVGVSQRHVHLSQADLETLFGKGYELTVKKVLMGKEFASNEVVTLVGPSLKAIENVRVLGPVRKNTQVEISRTDTFVLKVSPPVRPSGDIKGSEKMVLVGPKGSVYLKEGVIIANRHIHLSPEGALENGVSDGDCVDVRIEGEKPTLFYDVQVRVREDFHSEMHLDTDDANSAGLKNGNKVKILAKRKSK
ncbi:MAG: phosphate propanoyltransferase [Ruminococcaceae bacterium]|nr:phosphate propanoyltransferase [Oscillospiraceae bacterium]